MVNNRASLILVDLGVVLKGNGITTHDGVGANYTEFAEGCLYRVDFSSDVNGNYTDWFEEFVHEFGDAVQTKFRYINLSESGIDSDTPSFNQLDTLWVTASVDEDGQEYNTSVKITIEKLT